MGSEMCIRDRRLTRPFDALGSRRARSMFYDATAFKGDVSKWDVSNVTNMAG